MAAPFVFLADDFIKLMEIAKSGDSDKFMMAHDGVVDRYNKMKSCQGDFHELISIYMKKPVDNRVDL
jgi:hypothetical protein